MSFKPTILIAGLLLLCVRVNYGQLKIPTFDVELKVHQTLIPGHGDNGAVEFAETTNIYAGAHIQVNQHVALGGFYSRSFRGTSKIHFPDNSSIQRDVLFLQKGLDVRLSTGRAKNWRKYMSINYSQVELVQVGESFRLADKSMAFGLNLGFMRRLSNNLYLNVIDLGCTVITNDIFWFDTEPDTNFYPIFEAKMGLTYNIGKRK